jgi:N-methylhydantoinase B
VPFRIRADGTREPLEPIASVLLAAGELLGHELSGGGGYGDPLDREPALVRDDVLAQFVSLERARDVYGVVFAGSALDDSLAVDETGTRRRRDELRAGR